MHLNLLLKSQMYSFLKRFIDLVISSTAIIILLPIFVPISLILRFTGEGEIFYLQERIGKDKRIFKVFKFATMLKNSENMGSGIYTAKNDNRILPFGSFLRKSKINELPQVLNIFFGHISLVGPRPLIKKTFDLYDFNDGLLIASVKPGLTGIGSIVFRSEEEILTKADNENLEDFYKKNITPYKAELERWYIKNKNIYVDMMIIMLTVWVVMFKKSTLPWKIFKDLPKNKIVDIYD